MSYTFVEQLDGSRLATDGHNTGWYPRRRDGSYRLPEGWRFVRSGEAPPKKED